MSITSTVSKINADSKLNLNGVVYANYTGDVKVYAYWQTFLTGSPVSVTSLTADSFTFTAAQVSAGGVGTSFALAFDSNTFLQGRVYTFR